MSERKPWFLIVTPTDANRPGSAWKREGAASSGKLSVRPVASEGWAALAIFVVIWTMGSLAIWTGGYIGGHLSLINAVIATVVFEVVAIGGFILLVWTKSTRLPPA